MVPGIVGPGIVIDKKVHKKMKKAHKKKQKHHKHGKVSAPGAWLGRGAPSKALRRQGRARNGGLKSEDVGQ